MHWNLSKLVAPAVLCSTFMLFFSPAAPAQIPSRYAVFAGYSSRADVTFTPISSLPISVPNVVRLNGWNASFERRLIAFVGVMVDGSGHYGSYGAAAGCEAILICVPLAGTVHSSMHSLMAGPQLSFSVWRLTPFVHALFGISHINHGVSILPLAGLATSSTSFADAFGGGIDIRIASIVNARFQADFMQTRFFPAPPPISFIIGSQTGFRGSTGVVLRF